MFYPVKPERNGRDIGIEKFLRRISAARQTNW